MAQDMAVGAFDEAGFGNGVAYGTLVRIAVNMMAEGQPRSEG